MREIVDQCLGLIVKDDVDQVVWAFDQTYFWFIKNNYTYETLKNKNILRQFLEQISQNLDQKKYTRQIITNTDMANRVIRDKNTIAKIIQEFFKTLSKEDGVFFLGQLMGAYASSVPEPLFRIAKTFRGLHRTPDVPSIDDNLPMTDEMILYAWQYHWFYTWLGH